MQTNKKKGLTVKDLVTIGIFSALFLVFALVGRNFFRTQSGSDLLYACGKCIAVWTYLSSDDGEG